MMTIHAEWDNETKTVIRHDFDGLWTWNEFQELCRATRDMVTSVPHQVHIISDMRGAIMPRGRGMMGNMRRATLSAPSNRGIIVVVVNPFLKTLLSLFMSFDPEMTGIIYSAESVEEARQLIAARVNGGEAARHASLTNT
jgi:hypothetical protein